ncbi:hypothetical protein JL100_008820 [Skermanella mucosa]|uniref:hypothetical protein n=1 Tax=Skermanella mucosa TaxID=1789672 RepID=UPI00192AF3B1|nr:hypothetical protein [Skermanella mucosa]UEM22830.1 hypothetical protein JL100_008820 [Skermanella mucosa]
MSDPVMAMPSFQEIVSLTFRYGVFAFSVIVLFLLTNKSHNQLETARSSPNPDQWQTRIYLAIHGAVWICGISLIFFASYFWWMDQPQRKVYQFSVVNVAPHEFVVNHDLYVRSLDKPGPVPDAPQRRDLHFVVVSDGSFGPDHSFELEYFKNEEKKYRTFRIPYVPEKNLRYQIHYDAEGDSYSLQSLADASGPDFNLVSSALAQMSSGEEFPSEKLGRTRIFNELGKSGNIAPAPNSGDPYCTDNVFQNIVRCTPGPLQLERSGAPAASSVVPEIKILQVERSSVPSKINAIETLAKLPPATRMEVYDSISDPEPLIVTLLDLARHSDPELASKTRRLLSPTEVESALVAAVSRMADEPDRAAAILARVEPPLALRVLARVQMPRLDAARITAQPQLLVPTASSNGDRYYVKATWNPGDSQAQTCLTTLFNQSLVSNRTPEQESQMMANRSQRIIYWYSKEWALGIADSIRDCGARAEFVGF